MELSKEEELHIDSIASRELINVLLDDEELSEIAKEHSTAMARLFLAGCRAGVSVYGKMLELKGLM